MMQAIRTSLLSLFWVAAASVLGALPASADEFIRSIGNWDMYTWQDSDGRTESCYITVEYQSGTSIYIFSGPESGYELMFVNDDWQLTEGDEYQVSVEIDRFGGWNATLTALSERTVHANVSEEFIREFQRGYEMRVEGSNQEMYFRLDGTMSAVKAAEQCGRRHAFKNHKNPFGSASNSANANPFGGGSSNSSSSNSSSSSSSDTATSFEEATDLMRQLVDLILQDDSFSQVRYLKTSELEGVLDDYDRRWMTDGVLGAAAIVDIGVDEQLRRFLSEDSSECSGRFGSASQTDALTADVSVSRLAVYCDTSDSWYANYTVIPFDEYQIVVAHVSPDTPLSQTYDDAFVAGLRDFLRE